MSHICQVPQESPVPPPPQGMCDLQVCWVYSSLTQPNADSQARALLLEPKQTHLAARLPLCS